MVFATSRALVGAVCAMVLIRKKDFRPRGGGAAEPAGPEPAGAETA